MLIIARQKKSFEARAKHKVIRKFVIKVVVGLFVDAVR
jgi:hypothetical protein